MDTMTERHNTSRTTKSATKTPREQVETPPLTKEEALSANTFHHNTATNKSDGTCQRYRRNGATQTWVTRPNDYRIPVKYGIRARDQFSLTHRDATAVHTEENCPYRGQ